MNIVVIGLGSMGKRRIRLIRQIDDSINVVGVDNNDSRRKETEKMYGIKTCVNIDEALKTFPGIDRAVISTSPLSHAAIIKDCLERDLNIFTELNLVSDGYDLNMKLASEKNKVLFLSSTFLYRDEVRYIQKQVAECEAPVNYSYHIGQYLPDWHPWENYKSFFVGEKKTNGCREIMAIEFPWLINTFGKVKKTTAVSSKISSLELGYPDNFQILVEHESGTKGTLSIDVISRKPVRNLEIYGESLYLSWDGSATGLKKYNIEEHQEETVDLYKVIDHRDEYSAFVVENAYKNELISFFDAVDKGIKPVYGFAEDRNTLKLIDTIEGL